ncbi:MAG: glycine cleavage system protein GcvH [Candidatus Bathyarchaeia archaeon]|nr:glycine cleavage system protein GcvH [Candidatus Bathyarchaeota archaeon]
MKKDYKFPRELRYSKEHEWVKVLDDGTALIGISDYAQDQLHELVYVELPRVGREVKQMEAIGTVESVKAVSDVYSPISGVILEVNNELPNSPELINQDPYGKGWIAKVRPKNLEAELRGLMDSEAYKRYIETQR